MTKKRKLPAGKIPESARLRGRTLENELLARLLGPGGAPLDWLMKREPGLSREQAEALVATCRAAMEEGFSLVANGMGADGSLRAMGQLTRLHPWIDGRNLEEINRLGMLYAK